MLDRLVSTHATITKGKPGRQWETEHMNFALLTRLAAEFQGYCRDLHDGAIDHIVANLTPSGGSGLLLVTRSAFITGRSLDKGNPNWGNLCSDFKRIGLTLADSLETAYPRSYNDWITSVGRLMEARNAIAHGNEKEILACRQTQPLTLRTFRQWRGRLMRLAVSVDGLVGAHLNSLTGVKAW